MKSLISLALASVAVCGFETSAWSDSLDRAGSLLVYPVFENTRDAVYAITVTNSNDDSTPMAVGSLLNGTIDVEFVYIDGNSCLEFNRTRRLTPNDTITVTTRLDNPGMLKGYVYVFAKSPITGQAVNFNYLIGDEFSVSPGNGGIELPPIVFRASSTFVPGAATDVDNDGVRDFNDTEYERVSDQLIVPRFVAHLPGDFDPNLILIGLTGKSFTTIVNFLIYNDNEEVFSAQYAFDCWDAIPLRLVNGAFTDNFLKSTNHAANEFLAGPAFPPLLPAPVLTVEYGWYRMNGAVAFSTAATVNDPAFLAAHFETMNTFSVTMGTLPYGLGEQSNGDLVVHGPIPDNN